MKRVLNLHWIIILSLPLLFTSCGKVGNYGYPSKVVFNNSGGSKEVKGNDYPDMIEIADYDGESNAVQLHQAGDSMIVSYQWLTVKAKKGERKFTIIAEPKNGGKSRTLYVYAEIDPTEPGKPAEIKVVQ